MAQSVIFALILSVTVLLHAYLSQASVVYLEPYDNSTVSTVYLAIEKCASTYVNDTTTSYQFIDAYPTSNLVLVNFTTTDSAYDITTTACWNTTLSLQASVSSTVVPDECTSGCGASACLCELGQICSKSTEDFPCVDDSECDDVLSICSANLTSSSYTTSSLLVTISLADELTDINLVNEIASYIAAQQYYCGFSSIVQATASYTAVYIYLIQNNDTTCNATYWANLNWDIPGYSWEKPNRLSVTFIAAKQTIKDCFDSTDVSSLLCNPSTCNMKCAIDQSCSLNSDCASDVCSQQTQLCELYLSASVQQMSYIIIGLVLVISVLVGMW